MERIEKNIKSKLFDLYEERKNLTKRKVWIKQIGGLTRTEQILKNTYEINVLEKIL